MALVCLHSALRAKRKAAKRAAEKGAESAFSDVKETGERARQKTDAIRHGKMENQRRKNHKRENGGNNRCGAKTNAPCDCGAHCLGIEGNEKKRKQ